MQLVCPEHMEGAGYARLQIPNFSAKALGAGTMGPSSLDSVIGFCGELQCTLKSETKVCVFCSPYPGALANTLLLLGAYLVMYRGMSADAAANKLRVKADIHRFPAPWSPMERWHENSLSVVECLRGLEVAIKMHWFNPHSFDLACWKSSLQTWNKSAVLAIRLPSGKRLQLWAMADPVTTVADPTFRPFPPKERETPETALDSACEVSDSCERFVSDPDATPSTTCSTGSESGLEATHLKSPTPDQSLEGGRQVALSDFATWLKSVSCQRFVRLNFPNERRLPGGVEPYDDYFHHWGIQQVNLAFEDGTVPPDTVVNQFKDLVDEVMADLERNPLEETCSIVVHCTAGLGRTMTLIGSLAVQCLGISGGSWMGWARLVRPGSIQMVEQERYLKILEPEIRWKDALDERVEAMSCLNLFSWRNRRSV